MTGNAHCFSRSLAVLLIIAVLLCSAVLPVGAGGDTGNGSPATAPVAGFSADRTIGTAPLTVQFTDTTTGSPSSWAWDFGDGMISVVPDPSHTFQQPGTYAVTLTVMNQGGTARYTLPVTVVEREIIPEPEFVTNTSSGLSPLAVQFTDRSVGNLTAWAWDFNNDGIIDNTEQDPICVYRIPGNYTVTLKGTNAFRTKTVTKTDIILVGSPGPVVMFAPNNTNGLPPLAVRFTDLSEGKPAAWAWDFNDDGITDSTEQNATCVYNLPGNYTVTLHATNSSGSNTSSRLNLIMTGRPGPVAAFSANRTIGGLPLAVGFYDNSTGRNITSWAWDFNNDGIVDSTERNATCVYNRAGDYTVNLTVTGSFGSDTLSRPGLITVTNGAAPDFVANRTTGTIPLAVQFTDRSTGPDITGWAWDFNNDSVIDSTERNPSCLYKIPDNYTVNLIVTNDFGSEGVSAIGFITAGNPVTADFSVNQSSGIRPLAVRFTDRSTGPDITSWAWDFNNDSVIDSTEPGASCVYNLPGDYRVRLVVNNGTASRSVKESLIVVTSGAPRARFAVNRSAGPAPLTVQFRDMSIGENITARTWDFNNDGIVDSTEPAPYCVYRIPGNYTINYTCTNSYGMNSTIRRGFISVE